MKFSTASILGLLTIAVAVSAYETEVDRIEGTMTRKKKGKKGPKKDKKKKDKKKKDKKGGSSSDTCSRSCTIMPLDADQMIARVR